MKVKSILLPTLLFFALTSHAQQAEEKLKDWAAYSQAVSISGKDGYAFRVSAAIRMENAKKTSAAALWARIDKKDGTTGFFNNDVYSTTVSNQWKVYEINGLVDNNADVIYVGAFGQNSGDFYFDDFKVEVKKGNGKWETLPVKNPGFEEGSPAIDSWNYGVSRSRSEKIKNFSCVYSDNKPYKGKKALLLKGTNILGSHENGKYIEVNGVSLYYEIYGEGEPLLMIHGNGNSMSGFINQLEDFSKKYQVIFLDCRGRGNSTYQKGTELTFDLQIEDIRLFLDKLNLPKVSIVGWSDGGILGILMALKHPERVNKLVSMAANIFPEGCVDLDDMKKTRDKLVSENKDHKNDLFIDLYNLDINYPNLEYKDLNAIKSKTLIMAGDHDEIKNEHTVKIFEAIPEAQLAIVPNATHYLPLQNPKLFNQIVLDFLRE